MGKPRNLLSLLSRVDPDVAENVRLDAVPGGFVNLTGLAVSDQVAALLSFGPRFLMPVDETVPDVISHFGEIHLQVENHVGLGITGPIFLELLHNYKEETDKLFNLRQPSIIEVVLRKVVSEAKEFFQLYPHICIVQSDKGNKTCLMYVSEYQAKMDTYIQKCITKGVYHIAASNQVHTIRNIFLDLRNAILATPLPSTEEELLTLFKQLRQLGQPRLPHLYGNVKCHKADAPIRPICSTTSWYSRPIQKILHCILKRYFGHVLCRQNVKRVCDVAKDVKALIPRHNYVFVKLDVTDMYGSMDKKRICTLVDRLLDQIEREGRSLLPKNLVNRMLRFSLYHSSLVGYQGTTYVQLMGLPQGACDSGFLATLYMDYILQMHHEELFVNHRVVYWAKYMDDFLLYLPKRNITFFKQGIEYLTGLGFEIESEEEVTGGVYREHGIVRTIPFLDISIHTVQDGQYLVSSYRKPTASARMIHALSNTIFKYKVNTIHGFLTNLFRRTSTSLLEYDLDMLYSRVLMNGYSHNFVECIYYKALTKEEQNLLQQIDCISNQRKLTLTKKQRQITDLQARLTCLRGYKTQFSLDPQHHYQTIRDEYVATSRQPGYRFPYRSVSLSRLVFAACQYANMPPPVYCKASNCDVFRKFLAHKRLQAAMQAAASELPATSRRVTMSLGMLRCITCGKIFVVSGRGRLNVIVEEEMKRPTSEVFRHQVQFQHTISPAVQILRPISGIDTAYLCQLYLAIYHTMGLNTSDRFLLSSFPTFIRAMLNILRGADIPSSDPANPPPTSATSWLTRAVPFLPYFDHNNTEAWGTNESFFTDINIGPLDQPSANGGMPAEDGVVQEEASILGQSKTNEELQIEDKQAHEEAEEGVTISAALTVAQKRKGQLDRAVDHSPLSGPPLHPQDDSQLPHVHLPLDKENPGNKHNDKSEDDDGKNDADDNEPLLGSRNQDGLSPNLCLNAQEGEGGNETLLDPNDLDGLSTSLCLNAHEWLVNASPTKGKDNANMDTAHLSSGLAGLVASPPEPIPVVNNMPGSSSSKELETFIEGGANARECDIEALQREFGEPREPVGVESDFGIEDSPFLCPIRTSTPVYQTAPRTLCQSPDQPHSGYGPCSPFRTSNHHLPLQSVTRGVSDQLLSYNIEGTHDGPAIHDELADRHVAEGGCVEDSLSITGLSLGGISYESIEPAQRCGPTQLFEDMLDPNPRYLRPTMWRSPSSSLEFELPRPLCNRSPSVITVCSSPAPDGASIISICSSPNCNVANAPPQGGSCSSPTTPSGPPPPNPLIRPFRIRIRRVREANNNQGHPSKRPRTEL